ncbi:hypothetical protein [Microbacterium petrolearium]
MQRAGRVGAGGSSCTSRIVSRGIVTAPRLVSTVTADAAAAVTEPTASVGDPPSV